MHCLVFAYLVCLPLLAEMATSGMSSMVSAGPAAHIDLFIGQKTYSSWSLRPWIALKFAGVAFEEKNVVVRQSCDAAYPSTSARGKLACQARLPHT